MIFNGWIRLSIAEYPGKCIFRVGGIQLTSISSKALTQATPALTAINGQCSFTVKRLGNLIYSVSTHSCILIIGSVNSQDKNIPGTGSQ